MYNPNFRFTQGPFKGRGLADRQVVATLAKDYGIVRDGGFLGMDAIQPGLNTVASGGIPFWMANYHDPDTIRVLMAPLQAETILSGGARKIGDMATATATFNVIEWTGETSAYGDYNNNGSAGLNASFPVRQSFNFQTVLQYGALEVERLGLANINAVSEKKEAATWTINQFMNTSWFYGVAGLQNYGILNDPTLPAAIQPSTKVAGGRTWVTNGVVTATPNEVYNDIVTLYTQLVTQTQGLISLDNMSPITLAMSPTSQMAMTAANSFGVTAWGLIKEQFPNMKVVVAVQYNTSAGQLVQMIADSVATQKTGYAAYSERQRTFALIPDLSSAKQKIAAGTWGAIIRVGYAFAQMLGV